MLSVSSESGPIGFLAAREASPVVQTAEIENFATTYDGVLAHNGLTSMPKDLASLIRTTLPSDERVICSAYPNGKKNVDRYRFVNSDGTLVQTADPQPWRWSSVEKKCWQLRLGSKLVQYSFKTRAVGHV